jgi:hypothetical protein
MVKRIFLFLDVIFSTKPMDLPKFNFDYSFLDPQDLRNQCITKEEVEDLFYNTQTIYHDWQKTDGIRYMIGYSLKNKFISFTFDTQDDVIRFTSIFLSYEPEIRHQYYGF